jgi:hypothetical protein
VEADCEDETAGAGIGICAAVRPAVIRYEQTTLNRRSRRSKGGLQRFG